MLNFVGKANSRKIVAVLYVMQEGAAAWERAAVIERMSGIEVQSLEEEKEN